MFVTIKSKRYNEPIILNTDNILWLHSFKMRDKITNQPVDMPDMTRIYLGFGEYLDIESSLADTQKLLSIQP